MTLNFYLSPVTKVNSKCVQDFHTRPKIMKLPEEIIQKTFQGIVLGKDFLDKTPKHRKQKLTLTNGKGHNC
jgi:hypothetical protein